MTQKQLLHTLSRIGFWVLVIAIAIFTLFPFYWALNSSFKSEQEIMGIATYLPEEPTLINYQGVFQDDNFIRALGNSAIVSGSAVLLALTIGSFAAYALGRLQFKGRTTMLYAVLSMTMFPLFG